MHIPDSSSIPAMPKKFYRKGDYVMTTGYRLPSNWHTMYGIITDIKEYIVVTWDDTGVVDDQLPEDIKLVPRRSLIAEWEREIKTGRLLILQREFDLTPEGAEEIYDANPALLPHYVKEKFYCFKEMNAKRRDMVIDSLLSAKIRLKNELQVINLLVDENNKEIDKDIKTQYGKLVTDITELLEIINNSNWLEGTYEK